MEKVKIRKIYCFIALGAFLWLLPSVGLGQCNVSIGATTYPSINAAVSAAVLGDTINVSGTCSETVYILVNKNWIYLNGGGTATIQGMVVITGRQIFITRFNITGGTDGIQVAQGGTATINGNTIYNTGRFGIAVVQESFATIVNNTIHDTGVNPNLRVRGGIHVGDSSSATIGFSAPTDTVASPNIIRNNPNGIILSRSASARIVGNTISNNTDNGIMVTGTCQGEIADNFIDGNGQDGIFVSQGSGVNLGFIANPIFDLPNSGTNGNKGLSCSIGGYVDGLLGTLDGLHGALGISKGCINSVISHHDHGFSR